MEPIADPTTAEWAAVGIAAALIVLVGALHVVRPGREAAPWARLAAFLLAAQAIGFVLVVAVLTGAGIKAAGLGDPPIDFPAGPFAHRLLDPDPDVTEDIARYGTAVLLPIAAVAVTMALGVLGIPRGRAGAFRIAVLVWTAAGAVGGALIVVGDAGAVLTTAAWVLFALSAAALAATVLEDVDANLARQ